ncbi:cytochrome P450 1A1 [Aplysia californica]|uniref:Cytochrome P450 1A1 n=1 Tax=Aplysia californica TaxID=6500 RepID=A0ABM0JIL5_APLCA|nr:cytochrome P450 1A1 [Aplysia californica]XP_012935790.1 cytochrome P450 1A1 [Aplysia californica]
MDETKHVEESVQISSYTQVILIVLVTTFGIMMLTKKRYKLPPGPWAVPMIGNILSFVNTSFDRNLSKWHKKYGPVFSFSIGRRRMVVINEPEALNEALVKKGSDFSGRPYLYSMSIATQGNKSILMSTYGDGWKLQRKIASHALRQYLTGRQLEERVHEVLQPIIRNMLEREEAFDPHMHLSLTVFNILLGICFGTVMELDDPEFVGLINLFDEANDLFGNGFLEDFFPPLRLYPTKKFTRTMELFGKFNQFIYSRLQEQKEKFDPENVTNLTDNIILAKQEVEADTKSPVSALFTDTHASQTLGDVFGGGVDTTRIQLGWIFLVISTRPDIKEKVQEEVDRVIGDKIPGKEHRAKLVYTEAVMLEAMRLFPVAPLGVPHETLQDTTIGDYEIPAKTTVFPNQIEILHDPNLWEDPLTFKPERFLDESGTKLVAKGQGWVPFSMGHRVCLGESLARLQILYVLAGLVQKLNFSLSKDSCPDLKCNQDGLVNKPKKYKLIVTSR